MAGKQQGNTGLYVDTSKEADQSYNMRRISTWARQVSPTMWQVGTAIVGTLPMPLAPQDAYLLITGCPSIVFTSGAGSWTFPQPFPNGVVSATGNALGTGTAWYIVAVKDVTLTKIDLFLNNAAGTIGATVTISLSIVGW